MNLRETFQLAWENRNQITEGLWNKYISHRQEVKGEAARRLAICKSNICGYYDPEGRPENAAIPGKPSCSICKCNDELKTNCMSCYCALRDIQKEPLWEELMTNDMEKDLQQKAWEKQTNL
jgi:hypothetical protein